MAHPATTQERDEWLRDFIADLVHSRGDDHRDVERLRALRSDLATERAKPTTDAELAEQLLRDAVWLERVRTLQEVPAVAERLRQAANRLSEQRGDWQGIESAPDNGRILVYDWERQRATTVQVCSSGNTKDYYDDNGYCLRIVRHWQPLPKASQ